MKTLQYAIRFLARSKSYTLINLFGLAFSLACCIILMRYIHRELTVDTHCVDRENVYAVIREEEGQMGFLFDDELGNDEYLVETHAKLVLLEQEYLTYNQKLYSADIIVGDHNFFKLFSYNVIQGTDLQNTPNAAVLTKDYAHKLFGEFNLDDFPINQAKDGFVWDDGLEEEFIKQLKLRIKEYIEIAKMTNKDREKEEALSQAVSDNLQNQVQETINRSLGKQSQEPALTIFDQGSSSQDEEEQSALDLYKEYQIEQNNLPEQIDDKIRTYPIQLDGASKCLISVQWSVGNAATWIKVDPEEDGSKASIQLNINHPFFKPFSEKEDFKLVLEKFAIAFALAEIRARKNANSDGMISPNAFRTHINRYLRELTDDE